jgi:hypothetical protein
MKKALLGFAFIAIATGASAQIVSIGPFTGALSDSYETQTRHQFLASYPVFGGLGTVASTGGANLHITTGWSFFFSTAPHSGQAFLGGAGVNYQFTFTAPAFQFGGYFQTNADSPNGTATFFDALNNQIGGPLALSAPQGQWAWNGWQYAGGISRVVITASNQFGGYIMSDDIQYNAVPEPATLAALGLGAAALLRRRRRA